MKMKKRLLAVVLCAALISGCSYAENADRPGGGEEQLNTGQQDEAGISATATRILPGMPALIPGRGRRRMQRR